MPDTVQGFQFPQPIRSPAVDPAAPLPADRPVNPAAADLQKLKTLTKPLATAPGVLFFKRAADLFPPIYRLPFDSISHPLLESFHESDSA